MIRTWWIGNDTDQRGIDRSGGITRAGSLDGFLPRGVRLAV
jgi:hypothetical protein